MPCQTHLLLPIYIWLAIGFFFIFNSFWKNKISRTSAKYEIESIFWKCFLTLTVSPSESNGVRLSCWFPQPFIILQIGGSLKIGELLLLLRFKFWKKINFTPKIWERFSNHAWDHIQKRWVESYHPKLAAHRQLWNRPNSMLPSWVWTAPWACNDYKQFEFFRVFSKWTHP